MKLLVLPGDGIGPEITAATLVVLGRANEKFQLGLEWQREEIGFSALKKHGSTLPDAVMEAAIDCALQDPTTRTRDVGGQLGTRAFAERVAGHLS